MIGSYSRKSFNLNFQWLLLVLAFNAILGIANLGNTNQENAAMYTLSFDPGVYIHRRLNSFMLQVQVLGFHLFPKIIAPSTLLSLK